MPRLPIPGKDHNAWGNILNTFLRVEHNADGSLRADGSLAGKYSLPPSGIPRADLAPTVQTAVDEALKTRTVVTLGLTSGDFPVSAYPNFRSALLAGLAAAQAAKAELFIREGVYDLTAQAVFHNQSNVTVRGAGPGKTVIRRMFGGGQSMIDIGSGAGPVTSSNVIFRDLTIDQNNTGSGFGLAITWCKNVLVENLAFINQNSSSLSALLVGKFANASDNFEANNIRVVNCLFDYSTAPSLAWEVVTVTAGRDVSFEGCRWAGIPSNWPGLTVYNTEQFRMLNCFVVAAQITYGGRGTYLIQNNQFERSLLLVNQAKNTIISGNTFYSFGSTTGLPNGIQFKGGYKTLSDPETPWYITSDTVFNCENVIVDGNIFKDTKDNAIYAKTTTESGQRVLDCRDLQITNNKFEGCTGIPVVAFAKYLRIQNNQILNGNTAAIAGNDAHLYIAAEHAVVTHNYATSPTINNHGIIIDVERFLDVIPSMRMYQQGNILNTSTLVRHYNASGGLNAGPTTNVFWQPLTLGGGNGDLLTLDGLASNNSTLRFRSNGTERGAVFKRDRYERAERPCSEQCQFDRKPPYG